MWEVCERGTPLPYLLAVRRQREREVEAEAFSVT